MRKKQSKKAKSNAKKKVVRRKVVRKITKRKNPIKAAAQSPDELGYFSQNKEQSVKIEGMAIESFPDNIILKLFLPSPELKRAINIILYDTGINLLLGKLMTNSTNYSYSPWSRLEPRDLRNLSHAVKVDQVLGFVNIINSEKIININVEKIMGGLTIVLEMERKRIVPRIAPYYTIYLFDNGIRYLKQLLRQSNFPGNFNKRESRSVVGTIEDFSSSRKNLNGWDDFE